MKDHTLHQRKRVTEMLTNLLKDLGEVGHVLGNNSVETKVSVVALFTYIFIYINIIDSVSHNYIKSYRKFIMHDLIVCLHNAVRFYSSTEYSIILLLHSWNLLLFFPQSQSLQFPDVDKSFQSPLLR